MTAKWIIEHQRDVLREAMKRIVGAPVRPERDYMKTVYGLALNALEATANDRFRNLPGDVARDADDQHGTYRLRSERYGPPTPPPPGEVTKL